MIVSTRRGPKLMGTGASYRRSNAPSSPLALRDAVDPERA
jgi:hypothetical protein